MDMDDEDECDIMSIYVCLTHLFLSPSSIFSLSLHPTCICCLSLAPFFPLPLHLSLVFSPSLSLSHTHMHTHSLPLRLSLSLPLSSTSHTLAKVQSIVSIHPKL